MTTRQRTLQKNREIRHAMYGENARLAIGKLTKGCEIYGLTKGDVSLVNIIEAVLKQTGRAKVICATWAASGYDVTKLECLCQNDLIKDICFILDYSAQQKLNNTGFEIMNSYFPNKIFLTKTHAKFVLIKNDEWNICIRTSMNLNENKRIENFEISDCEILYNYMHEIASDIIAHSPFSNEKFKSLGRDEKYPKIKREKRIIDYSGVKLF